jgi:hypothetical protein
MMPRLHAPGCRYEGTDQPCGSSACHAVVLQEVRVLLTDAYTIFGGVEPDGRLKLDSLGEVWRRKYEKLIAHVKPCGN